MHEIDQRAFNDKFVYFVFERLWSGVPRNVFLERCGLRKKWRWGGYPFKNSSVWPICKLHSWPFMVHFLDLVIFPFYFSIFDRFFLFCCFRAKFCPISRLNVTSGRMGQIAVLFFFFFFVCVCLCVCVCLNHRIRLNSAFYVWKKFC